MWRTKACPRCQGDMYSTVTEGEPLLVCLLCGSERALDLHARQWPHPPVRRRGRTLPGPSPYRHAAARAA